MREKEKVKKMKKVEEEQQQRKEKSTLFFIFLLFLLLVFPLFIIFLFIVFFFAACHLQERKRIFFFSYVVALWGLPKPKVLLGLSRNRPWSSMPQGPTPLSIFTSLHGSWYIYYFLLNFNHKLSACGFS